MRSTLFFRRPELLAVSATFVVMVLLTILFIVSPGRAFIGEAVLAGERGLVPKDSAIAPGERLRLELRLVQPARVLVLLQDPNGEASEVFPRPGENDLIDQPAVNLPAENEYFETTELPPGSYSLWILARKEPFEPGQKARVRRSLLSAFQRAITQEGKVPSFNVDQYQAAILDLLREESLEGIHRVFHLKGPIPPGAGKEESPRPVR